MTVYANQKHRVGDIRPSQILYSWGVGATIDLPFISAMLMGLDDWDITHALPINEERLLYAVRRYVGSHVRELRNPPFSLETERSGRLDANSFVGIPTAPFPTWVYCPRCQLLAPLQKGLFKFVTNDYHPDRTMFLHENCRGQGKSPTVVPTRFLVACTNGHLDDFPFDFFVHRGGRCPKGRAELYWESNPRYGTPGDIVIRCRVCGNGRSMAEAIGEHAKDMPQCRGRHPHLNNFDECDKQMKTVTLGASNTWFSLSLSAMSIPSASTKLAELIEQNWTSFSKVRSLEGLEAILEFQRSRNELTEFVPYSAEQIWDEIQRKSSKEEPDEAEAVDLKTPEWRVLQDANTSLNNDYWQIRSTPPPVGFEDYFEKTVLVEKLREVKALIGFTRLDSPDVVDGEIDINDVSNVSLSRGRLHWLPATEVRGEGIFLEFCEDAIERWIMSGNPNLKSLQDADYAAHLRWCEARKFSDGAERYKGLRFLLLHSFAHALMRQLALECGYSAASLRERIYSRPPSHPLGAMAGILIYTATSDSEGTLGGLINLGEPVLLGQHVRQALEDLQVCTSDPLCSEHAAGKDEMSLHWAACHACLFSPETSCEGGNNNLDRSVLVPTFQESGRAFFGTT
jgi:hypothetical protein